MKLPLRLTLVAALAAPASLAFAQPDAPAAVDAPQRARRGHGMRGHHGRRGHFRRILRELNLSENQKNQIRAIMESAREQRQELRGQGRTPEARAARHALHEETRRLIREVLTPAQRTQAQRLRTEHRQRHIQRRVERMATRLSLTDAQKAAVTRIFEDAGARRHALRQAGPPDQDAMQTLRQQTRGELSNVLSAEQMAELREMHEARRERHGRRGRGRGNRGNRNGVAPIRNAAP